MTESRQALRQSLLSARRAWTGSPEALKAQEALSEHLQGVLAQLEPECLGLYWPVNGEFNPMPLALWMQASLKARLALPWATRASSPQGLGLSYRQWDGSPPTTQDECGIACPDTRPDTPDVVLVPCVGFAEGGWRLGYGGGYFDRFLAAHPHVTAVGVAWREAQLEPSAFQPEAHDQALALVVTPDGVMT